MDIPAPKFEFSVFIAGYTPAARRAIEHLNSLCDERSSQPSSVEVINILDDPDAAEENHILATPMVIRKSPKPVVRMVGDLSENDQALQLFE